MYKEENKKPEFGKYHETNPFRTPEGYFDSLEDRIMSRIVLSEKKKTTTSKIIRILKPVIGIAACLTVVYFFTHVPHIRNNSNSKLASTYTLTQEDDSILNFSLIDESTLVNAIFSDDETTVADINSDDMVAYLSSRLNDVEIYSEIQN
jgi:hypothetical protein